MGYFKVRYDSRVVNYDRRGFIRLATGLQRRKFVAIGCSEAVESKLVKLETCHTVKLPPTVSVLWIIRLS